jgi:hypothetical protein
MSQNRVRFVGKLRLPSKRRFTVTVMGKHGQRFTAADQATAVKARRTRTLHRPHNAQPTPKSAGCAGGRRAQERVARSSPGAAIADALASQPGRR